MQSDAAHAVSEEPQSIPSIDWQRLRVLSLQPGGFGEERARIWSRILNVDPSIYLHTPNDEDTRVEDSSEDVKLTGEPHPDERQIQLDTDRSFVLYPVVPMKEREKQQQELYNLIVQVFRKRRRLSYFQGYHDIVSVLFLTLPPELQLPCVERLSLHRARDSMGATLEPVLGLLRVLQRILRLADPAYAELLEENAPLPYFALSNLLTLFSHDMPTLPLIQHVFDYLLCRPPICVVYLAAAFILARKQEVERLQQEGEEGMIHSLLSALPDLLDGDDPPQELPVDAKPGHELEVEQIDQPTLEITDDVSRQGVEVSESSVDSAVAYSEEHSLSDGSTGSPEAEDTLVDPSVNEEEEEKTSFHAVFDSTVGTDLKHQPPLSDDIAEDSKEIEALQSEDTGVTEEDTTTELSSNSHAPGQLHGDGESTSSDDMPPKPRVTLSSLLERADELYSLYPPSHPSIDLSSIMGPQSVMLTWSENRSELPDDDEAELMVTQPHLIVLPPPEEVDAKEEGKAEEGKTNRPPKRRRRRLRKPIRIGSVVVEQRTVVASAVLVLSVAMAVYGMQTAPERHQTASRELKKLTGYVGGLVLGYGGRMLDRLFAER